MDTIVQNGWPVLFAWAFADQAGIPVPVVPLLIGAGALAGGQRLSLFLAIAPAAAASRLADLTWYAMGRRHGTRVLRILCRITLEPDSCVRRAQELFLRHRFRVLLIAKFLPGANSLAAGLAGAVGAGIARFVAYDLGSAVAWAGTGTMLRYVLRDLITQAVDRTSGLGDGLLAILVVSLVAYAAIKFINRQRSLRQLRISRISPAELHRRVETGKNPIIVDLRGVLDESADPYTIPSAIRMAPGELEARHLEIPRGAEIVLLCS